MNLSNLRGQTAYYFGTFDPVHLGHLTIARAAQSAFRLDKVVFVPTGHPPHRPDRQPKGDITQRLRMLELATADDPTLTVSDAESHGPGPHYTVATLTQLIGKGEWDALDSPKIPLIIGEDTLPTLPGWGQSEALLQRGCFLVAPRFREGLALSGLSGLPCPLTGADSPLAKGWWIPLPPWALSASWIREVIAGGGNASPWVSHGVWCRIQAESLYL